MARGTDDRSRFEPRRRARRRALQALYQWQLNPTEVAALVRQFREQQDFSRVDAALFERLVAGVVAGREELDRRLAAFLDRPAEQLDVVESMILRLAAFELLHSPDVPLRVILDEAVELARRFGAEQGHSYVNGVLDRAASEWRAEEYRAGSPAEDHA